MKKLKILPLLFLIFTISGCFGTEPNDIAYTVAIGFDKMDNHNYQMTIQFANPMKISGGSSEEGGKGGEIVDNLVVEAPNIYAGVDIANHILSKKISISHTTLLVFSEEVAKEGMKSIMETVSRSEELRPDIFMAISTSSAKEYLTEVKPVIELNPTKYYQLIYEKDTTGGLPRTVSGKYIAYENSIERDNVLPLAGIISGSDDSSSQSSGKSNDSGSQNSQPQDNTKQQEAPLNSSNFQYNIRDYMAGEVAINQKNKSEVMGMAIFKNEKMVGKVGGIEALIYNILMGDFKEANLTFYSEKEPTIPTTLKISQESKPHIKVDLDNKKIDVSLHLEADLYAVSAKYKAENELDSLEESVKEQINLACEKFIEDTINNYNSDIFGFGEYVKGKFLTYSDFENYDYNGKMKDFKYDVDTKMKVHRVGMTMRE